MTQGSKALLAALSNAGKPHVHEVSKKKEPKPSKNGQPVMVGDYYPPTLYLSDKDFPGICGFKSGDTRTLVITVDVTSVESREHDGKNGKVKEHNASMTIAAISDITAAKG